MIHDGMLYDRIQIPRSRRSKNWKNGQFQSLSLPVCIKRLMVVTQYLNYDLSCQLNHSWHWPCHDLSALCTGRSALMDTDVKRHKGIQLHHRTCMMNQGWPAEHQHPYQPHQCASLSQMLVQDITVPQPAQPQLNFSLLYHIKARSERKLFT